MRLNGLCLIALVLGVSCVVNAQDFQYISLIAPPTIFKNQSYTAFLTTSEFNVDTDFALKLRTDEGFFKIRNGQGKKISQIAEFKSAGEEVDYDDIKKENFKDKQRGYPLKILVRQNGKCIDKEIKLVYAKTEIYTFIQLDKPFYKPNDTIQYRVVAFNHETKPIEINSILVEIRDGEDNIVETKTSMRGQIFKSSGLFVSEFSIGEDPNLGNWTISVKINNNKRLAALKKFKVEKVKLPFFQVVIESEDVFHYDEGSFELKVYGKYAFGENAKGSAQVKIINTLTNRKMFEDRYRIESFKTAVIHFKNDMGIKFMAKNSMDFKIQVDFLDDALKTSESKSKNIKIFSQKNHFIEVFRPFPLEDGLDYEFDVVIRDYKGKIINYDSSETVKMQCTMIMKNGGIGPVLSKHVFIENSVAHFKIEGEKGVKQLQIRIEYLRAKTDITVTSNLEVSPSLRISLENPYIEKMQEEDLVVKVQYSQPLFEVFGLVFGKHGIVYQVVQDCYGDTECSLFLDEIKSHISEMRPEATLAVYSIVHDEKQVLYGSALLKFEELSDNKLTIEVPKESTPKKVVNLKYSSSPNSTVALTAIDKKLLFVREGHDITKKDVLDALTNRKRYVYEGNIAKDVIYDKDNHNFVINLALDGWRTCSRTETKLLSKMGSISSHKLDTGAFVKGEDTPPIEFNPAEDPEDKDYQVRKFFPDTWLFSTNKLDQTGQGQTILKTPDSITTWVFTGFSVSDQGFAVADPQEIVSSQEFFVELNTPYSIRLGEILKLEVVTFNFVPERYQGPIQVELTLVAEFGELKQQFEIVKYINSDSCLTQPIETVNQTLAPFQVPHRSGVRKVFRIKPLVTDSMTIRVEATATNLNGRKKLTFFDTVQKNMIVENQGVAHFDTKNFEFGPAPFNPTYYSHAFEVKGVKNQSIDLIAVITGSLMGPALNIGQDLIIMPHYCGEQSMSRYRTTLWNYIYLKNVGKLSEEDGKYWRKLLKKAYQNIMRYKKPDGGFRVWTGYAHQYEGNTGDASSTWMTAYSASILGASMRNGIDPINWEIVRNALKFCKSKQASNGSFTDVGYIKNPTPNDEDISRQVRITAFVLVSFLQNKVEVDYNFDDVIDNGLEFIEPQVDYDNYAAAIAAYAMILANRTQAGEAILSRLESSSETDGGKKFWNIEKGKPGTSNDTQILISSYVAMSYIHLNELDKARPIIKWLMLQKNHQGGYGDSHSTAVAMETLSMMGLKTGANTDTNIDFEFYGNSAKKLSYHLNVAKAMTPYLIEMPKKTLNLTIMGKGRGYGVVTTYYEYYKIVSEISMFFRVDASAALLPGNYANISAIFTRNLAKSGSDMVMMEFSLVSGYIYDPDRTKPMAQDPKIRNVEVLRGGTVVNFYYEKAEPNVANRLHIFAKKVYEIMDEKPASVKVYEYGHRDKTFTSAFYQIGKPGCV